MSTSDQAHRIGYLFDGIKSENAELQAAIAMVEEEDVSGGKINAFEVVAAHILPKDPVTKRRLVAAKRATIQLSLVDDGDEDSKVGIGRTVVYFRYYKPEEFVSLTPV